MKLLVKSVLQFAGALSRGSKPPYGRSAIIARGWAPRNMEAIMGMLTSSVLPSVEFPAEGVAVMQGTPRLLDTCVRPCVVTMASAQISPKTGMGRALARAHLAPSGLQSPHDQERRAWTAWPPSNHFDGH
jgi:hypothetical protein